MATPSPTHFRHRYRYLEAGKKNWKSTRHHMSEEDAAKFFAPGPGRYRVVEKWEPIEQSRMEISDTPPEIGPGVGGGRRKEPPRLTVDEIKEIWGRNRTPDVHRLIWEIWYLRQEVHLARYVATVVEVTGIERPFQFRLAVLLDSLRQHPSPNVPPLKWFPDEEAALERIAKARR